MEVRVLDTRSSNEIETFPMDASQLQWTASSDRIELTREAILVNSDNGIVRLVFMAFDRLEEILQPQYEPPPIFLTGEIDFDSQQDNTTKILNSKIISAALGKGRHIQLAEPARIHFKHLHVENVTNPSCVFWDYSAKLVSFEIVQICSMVPEQSCQNCQFSTKLRKPVCLVENESLTQQLTQKIVSRAWSRDGCRMSETNSTHTTCECAHLTNFAVLMDVRAVKLDVGHQVALQIITYVGCIISIVCLVLAILTFQLFRGLKSDRTTIHKNLCFCLLMAEALFVCGVGQTGQRIFCGVVAGLLHFFFLCAFAWMFLEGKNERRA